MEYSSFVTFTYTQPNADLDNCTGHNPDGTINAKYTLASMKDLLERNLSMVNKLIDVADSITDIIPVGFGHVEIKLDNDVAYQKLIDSGVTMATLDDLNSDSDDWNHLADAPESNQTRFNMLNNLINMDEYEFVEHTDSDGDPLISDERNINLIIDKYSQLLRLAGYDSESD